MRRGGVLVSKRSVASFNSQLRVCLMWMLHTGSAIALLQALCLRTWINEAIHRQGAAQA